MYIVQFSRSQLHDVTETIIVSTLRNDSTIPKAVKSSLQDPAIQEWIGLSPELSRLFYQKVEKELGEFASQSVFYFPIVTDKIGLTCFFAGNGHIF
jgi:hypothetical protein